MLGLLKEKQEYSSDLFSNFQKPYWPPCPKVHCGKICASSGQWFWKKYFPHITSAFVNLFSCVSKHVTHLGSWFGKQFLTKLTIFLLKMASPHCGYICASSGQWFWKNIFHTYHTYAFVKIFSCVRKHMTHLGNWFGKQFLTKVTIFLFKMTSPHCGYTCASSGQWLRNIFSTYTTLLRL